MNETTKRAKVLMYSLQLEQCASSTLAYLLEISQFQNSKSLGNSSSAISFNQKINLLLDTAVIDKNDKIILESFMNIRNQFMHNIDANSYESAVNSVQDLLNRLKKLYPENFVTENLEDSLEKCVDHLYSAAIHIFLSQKGAKLNKIVSESNTFALQTMLDSLDTAIKNNLTEFEKSIKNHEGNSIEKLQILIYVYQLKNKIRDEFVENSFQKITAKKGAQ